MASDWENLLLYVQQIDKRPAGFTREGSWSRELWSIQSWKAVDEDEQMAAYRLIEDIWTTASGIIGIFPDQIDVKGYEDLTAPFYSLYADMIWEVLRNHGHAPSN